VNHTLAHVNIPLELRLVMYCLRVSAGQDCEDQIRGLCRKDIHWESFIRLVDHHRVVSPVYGCLKHLGESRTPEWVVNSLRDSCQKDVRRVLLRSAELVRMVKQFQREGISVLPFKGPVLALQAYGDLNARHAGDLDILVPPNQTSAAEAILLQNGYERTHPAFDLSPKQHRSYVRSIHHFGYVSRQNGIRVELHWRFGSNPFLFPFQFDDLWRERQCLRIGGTELSTLSLEHTLLLLCVHGADHAWFRLFWLNDVAQFFRKNDGLDWRRLMPRAEQTGIGRMVAEGVILSHLFLKTPLPEPVREYAEKDKAVYPLVFRACQLIKHPHGPSHRPMTPMYSHAKFHGLMLRKDMRYKMAFCLKHFETATYVDWERFPLPDRLFPLYALIRPFTWLFRWYIPMTRVYQDGPTGRRR